MVKHLRVRLVSGLLVLIPLAITVFILNVILSFLTSFVRPLMRPLMRPLAGETHEYLLTLIALLVTVVIVYLVGFVTTHIVGRRIIHWGERLLMKVPLEKTVYSASKQVVDTFSSPSKAAFQTVVRVEFPRPGSFAIGFVTGSILDPQGHVLYRVFIATTPNPTSGFLILYPKSDVQFTDLSVEDGIKMIVSGGMLAPASYQVVESQG